ncbi:MAG TPA: hypothetical protein VGI13_03155 [Candidatus Acidoferrum sp.]|jgi:uncharacterized damage-inducible protein DinB
MKVRTITESLGDKVLTTVERTGHLVSLIPADKLDWRPVALARANPGPDLGHLLGHLLDCMAGFCAAFYAAFPAQLEQFAVLRSAEVNHFCQPRAWKERAETYRQAISEAFELCGDEDLSRRIKTIFNPEGQTLLSLLLDNLEHLLNHKYQLFFNLKLTGVSVGTQDLYTLTNTAK